MKVEELVIRFLAFHYTMDKYRQPLAGFLNDFSEQFREPTEEQKLKFSNLFDRTVRNLSNAFGELAFRVFDADLEPINNFNAALFDAEIIAISQINHDVSLNDKQRKTFLKELSSLFYDDDFIQTISKSTSNKNQVKKRIDRMSNFVKSYFDALQ